MIGALLLTLGAFAPVQDTTPRELGRDEARVALDRMLSVVSVVMTLIPSVFWVVSIGRWDRPAGLVFR